MKKINFSEFFKTAGGMTGLLAVLAIVVAANVIIRQTNLRIDLTEEQLYSLSDGTKNLLSKLENDITLKFFFNAGSKETPIPLKNFARQVEDLLKEYRIASNGRVKLEIHDPEPDSEAEEWAQRYGLRGRPAGMLGNPIYCGIVGVSNEREAVLPSLSPGREGQLEYDITRMIAQLDEPERPVIGVMSFLPVFGTPDMPFMMPGQPQPPKQPPWFSFSDLQKDYDVRTIETTTDLIPEEIDALIIVHPKDLPEPTEYAVDQFLLRGGRIIAFLDPFCVVDAISQEQQPFGMPEASSTLKQLLPAWGVTFDKQNVIADMNAATRIMGRDNKIEENPAWLSLSEKNFDSSDILTSGIGSLLMANAGSFSVQANDGIEVTRLIESSENSALISLMSAQFGTDAIKRDFRSGNTKHTLAVRLHGLFKTAFPQFGDRDESDDREYEHLAESSKPGAVILIGDVDMLFDQFCVQEANFMGFRGYQPINDNLVFFANAVEQLCGSEDLIGIRSRGTTHRPFTKVLEIQKEAQVKWIEEEQLLETKLNDLQMRLSQLQQTSRDQTQRFILTPEQEEEIKRFREDEANTQGRLREVRRSMRQDIESLGAKVKAINILLAPILVGIAGIGFGIYRKKGAK